MFRREHVSDLVPQQVTELSRDYVSPPADSTGTTTEREILADELRREMSASILRRIDSVVRAELERGQLNRPAKPAADPAATPAGVPPTTPPADVPPVNPPQGA